MVHKAQVVNNMKKHYFKISIAAICLFLIISGFYLLFGSQRVSAAIGYIGNSAQITGSSGATQLTIPKAANIVAGDVMIAQVTLRSSSTTITPPAGWLFIRRDSTSSSSISSALYYKFATSLEPISYTWKFSNTQVASGGIVAYRGVNTIVPIDVHSGRANGSNERVITANSVTTTQANEMLLFIGGLNDNPNGPALNPPSGMTERLDMSSAYTTTYFAEQQLGDPGPTGNKQTITNTDSQFNSIGQLVALRPPAAPTSTPTPTPSPTPIPNPTPTPTSTPTPTPTTYTITGRVFNDDNKNGIQDAGEPNYVGTPSITASQGIVTTKADGTYTISNLPAGTVTISYQTLPEGYSMTSPRNGPPPSYQVTVGPGCDTNSAPGASCQ